jgi:ribonuclease D
MASLLPPPVVVTTGAQFGRLIPELESHSRLAVDTESNSLHAYRERVCLIQITAGDSDYLIDPLAVEDLSPLRSVFAAPGIEKIFHAAEYDLACLHRDFGFVVQPIFDTRVAVRTLGYPRTGLGDLLEEAFGVHLDKRHQRANWGKRPLPPPLLDYARLDTHYLEALRDRLAAELEASGRMEEARQECRRVTLGAANGPAENGEEPFWKITHARRLNGRQAAILRELHRFREGEARRRDTPPFKVLSDSALLAVAQAAPRTRLQLEAVEGVPATTRKRYGDALLEAVRIGGEAPPPRRPSGRNHDEAAQLRFQHLRDWRRSAAAARGVESDVILPKDVAWEIARSNPPDLDSLHALMTPLEARFAEYGPAILAALEAAPVRPGGPR